MKDANDRAQDLLEALAEAFKACERDVRADECARLIVEMAASALPESVVAAVARLRAAHDRADADTSLGAAITTIEENASAAFVQLSKPTAGASDEPRRHLIDAVAWGLVALEKLEAAGGGGS